MISMIMVMSGGQACAASTESGRSEAKEEKRDVSSDNVIVKIGDKTFSREDVQWRIDGMSPDNRKEFQTNRKKKELLDNLVKNYLFAQEARSMKMDKEKGVAASIEDLVNYQLAQVYNRFVVSNIQLSDNELKEYYDRHLSNLKSAHQVRAQHILIKLDIGAPFREEKAALQKANSIRAQLMKNKDFNSLAKKYSQDTETKDKGGDVGFFSREQMLADFADAAFSLKPGQISKPVRSILGYHIIKVTDVKEPKVLSMEDLRETLISRVFEMKRQKAISEEIDKLMAKYNVTVFKENEYRLD